MLLVRQCPFSGHRSGMRQLGCPLSSRSVSQAYTGIVLLDDISHTGHATVAHLTMFRLITLSSSEPTGKCLLMSFKNFSPTLHSYYVLTIRWVKPAGYPSCTIPLQNRLFFLSAFYVLNVLRISTLSEHIVGKRCSFLEYFIYLFSDLTTMQTK